MYPENKDLSIIDQSQLTLSNVTETGDNILDGNGQLSRIPGIEGVEYDIRLEDIVPNPEQPRESFDDEEIEKLKSSMKEVGQKDSISVVPFHEIKTGRIKFFIVDGGSRHLIAKTLGWESLRAIVKWIPTKKGIREEALIIGIARSGYNPIDMGKALQQLAEEIQDGEFVSLFEAIEKVHLKTGLSVGSINRFRSLLNLPSEIQDMLRKKQISPEAALDLAKTKKQVGDDLDLGAVANAVTQISDNDDGSPESPKAPPRRLLDAAVDFQLRRANSGKAGEISAGRVVRRFHSAIREAISSIERVLEVKDRDIRVALPDPSSVIRDIKKAVSLLVELGGTLGTSSSDLGVDGQFLHTAANPPHQNLFREPLEHIVFRDSPTRRKVDGLLNWHGSDTAKRLLKILSHRADIVGQPLGLEGLANSMNLSTAEVLAAVNEIRDILISVDLSLVQTGSQENPSYQIENTDN